MYTGFVWESIDGLEVMDYVDVLVDGEFVKEEADPQLHWKGSANQRVIDVKADKKERKKSSYTVLKAVYHKKRWRFRNNAKNQN